MRNTQSLQRSRAQLIANAARPSQPWMLVTYMTHANPAQEGDFYGGWATTDIVGLFKGGPGTWGW
jgi:hypothetical protein